MDLSREGVTLFIPIDQKKWSFGFFFQILSQDSGWFRGESQDDLGAENQDDLGGENQDNLFGKTFNTGLKVQCWVPYLKFNFWGPIKGIREELFGSASDLIDSISSLTYNVCKLNQPICQDETTYI